MLILPNFCCFDQKPEKISFFTCFLLILSRKKKCSQLLKSHINCFNEPQNDWCGFTKSNNVKSLVKKDEKLTKIEFFKIFRISTRIFLGGGGQINSPFASLPILPCNICKDCLVYYKSFSIFYKFHEYDNRCHLTSLVTLYALSP